MGEWLSKYKLDSSLKMATSLEKENSEFKPVKFHLKIDLVLHPAYGGVVGKYVNTCFIMMG